MELCWRSQVQLKNEVVTIIIKQSRMDKQHRNELQINALLQLASIFLHCFKPEREYLLALIKHLKQILDEISVEDAGTHLSPTKQYINYILAKVQRMLNDKSIKERILKIPPNYQLLALQWHRQIWLPIFLTTGTQFLASVDYFETIHDLKMKILTELQVNLKRIPIQMFGLFETMHAEQTVQSILLQDEAKVWDILSRWEEARELSAKQKKPGIIYILMLKVKFAYELDESDLTSLSLFFSQSYFDMFINQLKVTKEHYVEMISCIKMIQYGIDYDVQEFINMIPESLDYFNDRYKLMDEIKSCCLKYKD